MKKKTIHSTKLTKIVYESFEEKDEQIRLLEMKRNYELREKKMIELKKKIEMRKKGIKFGKITVKRDLQKIIKKREEKIKAIIEYKRKKMEDIDKNKKDNDISRVNKMKNNKKIQEDLRKKSLIREENLMKKINDIKNKKISEQKDIQQKLLEMKEEEDLYWQKRLEEIEKEEYEEEKENNEVKENNDLTDIKIKTKQ